MNNPSEFSIRFLLAVLATWRITHLLANEDGPLDAIYKLRAVLGKSMAGSLMDCFKCLSLWIAVPAACFVTRVPMTWVVVWLAVSGSACLLERAREHAAPRPHGVTENEQGDFNHVLWSEKICAAECAILGDVPRAGEAADQLDDRAVFNRTWRA
jgi:hypothetical protein